MSHLSRAAARSTSAPPLTHTRLCPRSGVNINHVEFEGRAKWGKTIPKDADQDLNGHGSHVAVSVAWRVGLGSAVAAAER